MTYFTTLNMCLSPGLHMYYAKLSGVISFAKLHEETHCIETPTCKLPKLVTFAPYTVFTFLIKNRQKAMSIHAIIDFIRNHSETPPCM